jgi:hypothetical protein
MSKARSTGNIGNIIKTSATCVTVNDGTTDLLIMSGSGRVTIPGNLVVLGGISGSSAESSSYSLSSSFATNANTLDGIDGASFLQTGSFNTFSSSIDTTIKNKLNGDGVISGSVQVDITSTTGYSTFSSSLSSSIGSLSGSVATTTSGLSSSIGSLSSSVATTTSGLASRIGSVETKTGSYATTGSNIFVGSQVITGSLYITNDMIVQGCSCLQNITASAVSIGTNTVMLNTATPAVRFAGISVQDSGSNAGVTGSIYWDGLCNKWIYSNPSTVGYSGGMLISGPRNTGTIGSESPLTCNYIAKSGGGDHIYDSCIVDDGTTVCINANLKGSGTACFAGGLTIGNGDTKLYSAGTSLWWGANGGTDYGQLNWNTGEAIIAATTGNQLTFRTNGVSSATNRMIITCGGNVGIGCNSPTYHLEVRCAASTSCCYLTAMFARSTGANDGIGDIIAFGANGVSSIAGMYRSGGGSWGLELQTANQNTRMRIDNSGISCFACQLCAPVGVFSGCVSIGSTSPNYANLVLCNPSANSGNNSALVIGRATSLPSAAADYGNIYLFSTDCYAADKGGTISFGSQYGSTGGDTKMSGIFGGKENASNGDYSGYLSFYTRLCGGFPAERVRITSSGVACFSGVVCAQQLIGISSATVNGPIYFQNGGNTYFQQYVGASCDFVVYNTTNNGYSIYTNSAQRFTICGTGNATFGCSVNFNGNGSIVSKVGGIYNGTTTVTIGPSGYNGVMQIMVGVYGNGSGNTGRAMWLGGGYIGSGMGFTEVTRYCAGAVTIGALNANAGCYTFTVGYSFPNSADISVTVIGTNANTAPATISFG